jgi:hypothetical protein
VFDFFFKNALIYLRLELICTCRAVAATVMGPRSPASLSPWRQGEARSLAQVTSWQPWWLSWASWWTGRASPNCATRVAGIQPWGDGSELRRCLVQEYGGTERFRSTFNTFGWNRAERSGSTKKNILSRFGASRLPKKLIKPTRSHFFSSLSHRPFSRIVMTTTSDTSSAPLQASPPCAPPRSPPRAPPCDPPHVSPPSRMPPCALPRCHWTCCSTLCLTRRLALHPDEGAHMWWGSNDEKSRVLALKNDTSRNEVDAGGGNVEDLGGGWGFGSGDVDALGPVM